MDGLSWRELRFAFLISSSHFTQHVFYRILPPLIPVLAVVLEYPLWQLGLLITLYSLGMGLVQAPLGILSDRIDRRYLLPSGLAIAGAAYVLFAFAPSLGTLLPAVTLLDHTFEGGFLVMALAMVFVGIGLAVVHPAGYPMITDNVDTDNKGTVLGVFGASSKFGDAATPALIAGLLLILAWEQIILLFGIGGILYGIGLYAALRTDEYETMPSGQRNETSDGSSNGFRDRDRRSFFYPITIIYLFFISSGLILLPRFNIFTLSERLCSVWILSLILSLKAHSSSNSTNRRSSPDPMDQLGRSGNGRGYMLLATSGASCAPEVARLPPNSPPALTISKNNWNASSVTALGNTNRSSHTFTRTLRRRSGSGPPPWSSMTSVSLRKAPPASVLAANGVVQLARLTTASRS